MRFKFEADRREPAIDWLDTTRAVTLSHLVFCEMHLTRFIQTPRVSATVINMTMTMSIEWPINDTNIFRIDSTAICGKNEG